VEKSPNAVAQCTVRACSLDNRVVGRRTDIVVGPASHDHRIMTVTVVVPTDEMASAVDVEGCRIVREG
jgi:hypothetical protein